ncbi:hypothetical protein ACUWEX_11135 [Okibacterium fritillariae]|uniref:hypothetical protein n=1 Tax=Okibacterium fritillariae TaxID=123320 RepID=UPI0040558B3F
MTEVETVIAGFRGRIQQKHLAVGKFAAVVVDEETRAELMAALAPYDLRVFVKVAAQPIAFDDIEESKTDKIEIAYTGVIEVRHMKPTGFGKIHNKNIFKAAVALYKTFGVFEPVILRKDMTVIDGEMRVAAAKELDLDRLPAIVLNATELQAKFLRLVLNKSNEFQRWHWDEVDAFLEQHPEFLPHLEPLGIFGERVVPKSYLAKSVTDYEIHEETIGKTQQAAYKQEHGLARWATIERAERAIEEQVRAIRRKK